MVCKNCGRNYTAPPAMSRNGLGDICPVCGAAESLSAFPDDMKAEILNKIEEQEIA